MSEENKELQDLIKLMSSREHDLAWKAVSMLEEAGWLTDGSLEGAQLPHANLKGATLIRASLRRVNLAGAFLQSADLYQAKLGGADLSGGYLQGADLSQADLEGSNLKDAKFDASTVLPDGTNWTPGLNMTRFTDPNHPDFWRSDDPNSPAHRGEE